jgi:reactive intermediate/imine deaminase
MKSACILVLSILCLQAAEKRVIAPPGAKVVGPYSPGILAGDYLYVSGQGAAGPNGIPASFEDQVRQSMDNVKGIVEAAGLTLDHIVYAQVYLLDTSRYGDLNRILAQYFGKNPPARAVLGVYKMPVNTPVEINAVAVRDLAHKKRVDVPGFDASEPVAPAIQVGDRLYVSGMLGLDDAGKAPDDPAAQVQLALDRMGKVLKAAGMDFRNMVFVNPYLTKDLSMEAMNQVYAKHFEFGNTPARATIPVNSLPLGARIEYTGVAVRDLSNRRAVRPKNMAPSPTASPCVIAEDTYYCSAKSAFIPGPNSGIYAEDVETQVRMSMRNLLDGLEEAGLDFSHVVSTNVYLDNIDDFPKMNRVYASFFSSAPPTRTTVSPLPPVERRKDDQDRWPKLEEISVIAVKP